MGSFSIRINASAVLYCLSPTGFSIRINTSRYRYCRIPTGECVLKFSLYINPSVQCKLSALI